MTLFLRATTSHIDYNLVSEKKHSITHALISITDKIKEALDNGDFACGVFVDLQKVFDTVNHDILLKKMENYGIRGSTLKWFQSYLYNRFQNVSILGFDSKLLEIKHGVPQGSVLGPLLFSIYINDLHNAIKFSNTYHFADDTNLLNINANIKKLQYEVNYDLKQLCLWLLANQISLNTGKTELIFFRKPNVPIPLNRIKINGLILPPSKSIKYLGLYLDEHLNGSAHAEKLFPKLRRACGMLSKIRHYTTTDQTKTIYHAIFASQMTYGCQIWGQTHNKNILNKIQTMQNNAIRLISFTPNYRDHVTPFYIEKRLLKIKDIISLKNMLFIHDSLNNKLPSTFNNLFIIDNNFYPISGNEIRAVRTPKIATFRGVISR